MICSGFGGHAMRDIGLKVFMIKQETDAQLAIIQVMHATVLSRQCVLGALVGQRKEAREG